jgi:osmotically-inducible protein OsmY
MSRRPEPEEGTNPLTEKLMLVLLVVLPLLSILMSLKACSDWMGDDDDGAAQLAGADATKEPIPETTDEEIGKAIQYQYFMDGLVPPTRVTADVDYGVVTLTGEVDNIPVRRRAVAIARSIKNVRAVVDQITVQPPPRDDASIHGEVMRALKLDCVLDPDRMEVELDGGEATIHGSVESWSEKYLAGRIVGSIRGVRDVYNHLLVKGRDGKTDEAIRSEVEELLSLDPYIDTRLITVNVSKARVLIKGALESAMEVARAERLAHTGDVASVRTIPLTVELLPDDSGDRPGASIERSNDDIVLSILEALRRDARIPSTDVNATIDDGTASLLGNVQCLRASAAAASAALQVRGVMSVQNHITVLPADPVDDESLEDHIDQALRADAVIAGYEIGGTAREGRVALSGTVDNMQQKLRARDVVARLRGIVSVENDLRVKQTVQWKSDHEIERDLHEEIFWNCFIDEHNLQVTVVSSVAVLSGTLSSWQQVRAAAREALDAGAVAVESNVQVNEQQRPALLFDGRNPGALEVLAWPPPMP